MNTIFFLLGFIRIKLNPGAILFWFFIYKKKATKAAKINPFAKTRKKKSDGFYLYFFFVIPSFLCTQNNKFRHFFHRPFYQKKKKYTEKRKKSDGRIEGLQKRG